MRSEQPNTVPFEDRFRAELESGVLDIPERVSGLRPVIFVPGWDSEIIENKDVLRTIHSVTDARLVSAQFIGGEETEKAKDIAFLINDRGLKDVDIMAHSLGGFSAMLAILDEDIDVHRMVLINPAGMAIDPESTTVEAKIVLKRRYIELLKNEKRSAGSQNVGGLDGIRAMAEFVAGFGMYEKLCDIRDMGIRVITIHGENDELSPWADIKRAAEDTDWVESRDAFFVKGLGHMGISEIVPEVLEKLVA